MCDSSCAWSVLNPRIIQSLSACPWQFQISEDLSEALCLVDVCEKVFEKFSVRKKHGKISARSANRLLKAVTTLCVVLALEEVVCDRLFALPTRGTGRGLELIRTDAVKMSL